MKIFILVIFVVSALAPLALGQSTAFTYQGRLRDGGEAASGLHDFRFKLFDAPSGGSQKGQTQCANNVAVADGLFTTLIDFGQQFATPSARYLEIQVREDIGQPCTDDFGYVLLSPRQLLAAAPMASHAKSAFSLDAANGSVSNAVFVDNAGNVGIGTTAPTAKLDVVGGPMVVVNEGDQADLFWFGSERSWVFRQEGTGSGSALKLESVGGGGNKNFIFDTDGFVGIGATSPLAKLDVRGDILFGSGAQVLATGSDENLRIVRGNVAVDIGGENLRITAGSGFSVSALDIGRYRVTFDRSFAGTPTVTASGRTGNCEYYANVASVSSGGTEIRVLNSNSCTSYSWGGFTFIAVGPR